MERRKNVFANAGQPSNELVTSLGRKLQNLSSLPSECCIYRVPERLRYANAKGYTPQFVSIGPFHHGEEGLQAMEEDKMLYLQSFLNRTKIGLERYIELMREKEQKVRNHYAETFERINSNQFVEMILVDAAFVIELLCKNYCRKEIDKNDRIFHNPVKLSDIRYDMMLLENQLPFFLFEDIFPLTKLNVPLSSDRDALIKITHRFFQAKAYLGEENKILEKMGGSEIKHFVDFFRQCHVPTQRPGERKIQTLTIPSVTELYNAGAKFRRSSGGFLDIKFSQGTLHIPHLQIRTSTESFIVNMLAFEQRHFLEYYINDYVFILNRLINSTKDVQLLARSGVIESKLPDAQEIVRSINNLARGNILRLKHFNFKDLCDGLNEYYSDPWNTWMTTLKHHYFSSPLTIFAVVVASAVFILTVIQTVCSIIQTVCSCGGPSKN